MAAAVIAQGTLDNQRVITATLATIAAEAAQARIESPALLIVGDVVSLHRSLAWFNGAAPLEVSRIA
jgi:uroporphyrin-III C-methyltransferase/precorrin-2 dehydrogenase/sirohydrochlorin ferrochelatase